jgi:hypothetical protein
MVRLWNLDAVAADPALLMNQLRRATGVCLAVDQRMQYLDEPAAVASDQVTRCEQAGRP